MSQLQWSTLVLAQVLAGSTGPPPGRVEVSHVDAWPDAAIIETLTLTRDVLRLAPDPDDSSIWGTDRVICEAACRRLHHAVPVLLESLDEIPPLADAGGTGDGPPFSLYFAEAIARIEVSTRDVGVIRFGGHQMKGGYGVDHGQEEQEEQAA